MNTSITIMNMGRNAGCGHEHHHDHEHEHHHDTERNADAAMSTIMTMNTSITIMNMEKRADAATIIMITMRMRSLLPGDARRRESTREKKWSIL